MVQFEQSSADSAGATKKFKCAKNLIEELLKSSGNIEIDVEINEENEKLTVFFATNGRFEFSFSENSITSKLQSPIVFWGVFQQKIIGNSYCKSFS